MNGSNRYGCCACTGRYERIDQCCLAGIPAGLSQGRRGVHLRRHRWLLRGHGRHRLHRPGAGRARRGDRRDRPVQHQAAPARAVLPDVHGADRRAARPRDARRVLQP
nr:MAG TPA: hypothetical protein [Caudoviricetes sp.]